MIYTKYGISILAFILFSKALNAQTSETSNCKNFFDLKTDYDFQSQKQYEKITIDSQIIAVRRFHADQFTIAEEYLHFKNDTFLYREYSSIDHQLTSSGKVVASICCSSVDTSYTFDPQTYEEKKLITKYWNWSKEGRWEIENTNVYEYGNYKNNLKVGEWYVWDKNIKSAKYVYFDNFGIQRLEEPQNLIQTNNKERVIKEIVGIWRIEESTNKNLRLRKEKEQNMVRTYGSLVFDSTLVEIILRLQCGTGFDFKDFKKRNKGHWIIDDENVISMQVYGFEDKKYKITYLSRYEMRLMVLK